MIESLLDADTIAAIRGKREVYAFRLLDEAALAAARKKASDTSGAASAEKAEQGAKPLC